MKIHTLRREQFIPANLDVVWLFFSSPLNLTKITPDNMGFKIINQIDEGPIRAGMEIHYIIKPLFHIPLRWTTRISSVNKLQSFTDVQIKGPYALWEHTHTFIQIKGGVTMIDDVRYALPYGLLGNFVHWSIVKERLNYIFDYRNLQIDDIFKEHGTDL